MLYLWAKDNHDFGYRQGMNEILAVLVYAFHTEVMEDGLIEGSDVSKEEIDFSKELDIQQINNMTDDEVTLYIFNEKYIFADIYWCFERVMSLGVRNLYQITKDLSTLKEDIIKEMGIDLPANSQKGGGDKYNKLNTTKEQDQMIKDKLEKACEDEKAKSVITNRCQRIYEQIIKSDQPDLYDHLIVENQMSPELQLMRWLKCMLSREFSTPVTMQCWDYILGGVYNMTIKKYQ